MATFDEYANKYKTIRMRREDGILEMTLHTDGGPLQWGGLPHGEIGEAFHLIGSDPENRVIILTGTGDTFSGPRPAPGSRTAPTPTRRWDRTYWEGKQLLMNMLDIEVPMISAVNGPCLRHSELPLLCDIVLASETASFQDSGHFVRGLMPGDGVHILYPLLMGLNRGKYFILTGQELSATEAKDLGLVGEVLPPDRLQARAWELARQLTVRPTLLLRYTRVVLNLQLRRLMEDMLGYGLALEGLAAAAVYDEAADAGRP